MTRPPLSPSAPLAGSRPGAGATGPVATSALVAGRVLLGRNLLRLRRNPSSISSTLVVPLIFLLGFFAVLQRSVEQLGIDYAQYLPPLVVVLAMYFVGYSSAIYVTEDRSSGMYDRLVALPMDRRALLVGRVGADLARACASLLAVVLGAAVLGFRFEAGVGPALAFVGISLQFAVTSTVACGIVGLTARDPRSANAVLSLPYLPLILLSTGLVPLDGFPGWIQPVVKWQPVSLTVDALRATSSGGPTTRPVVEAVVVLGAILVVSAGVATRMLLRRAR